MPLRFRFPCPRRDKTLNTSALRITLGFALVLGLSPVFSVPLCQGSSDQSTLSQEQMLAAARRYAGAYMANLPSFLCTQINQQFEGDKKGKHWRKGDRLTSQLIWDQGREQRTLQSVNDRPLSNRKVWRAPLTSEGELGNLMDSILGKSSSATFNWRGHATLDGKQVGVFEYEVDQQHSSLRLTLGGVEAVIAFHGLIYVDETGVAIWRITNEADRFPAELRTKSISRSVDYAPILIGATQYVLPVQAIVVLDTGKGNIKNELRFDKYRKFSADSRISFAFESGANKQ